MLPAVGCLHHCPLEGPKVGSVSWTLKQSGVGEGLLCASRDLYQGVVWNQKHTAKWDHMQTIEVYWLHQEFINNPVSPRRLSDFPVLWSLCVGIKFNEQMWPVLWVYHRLTHGTTFLIIGALAFGISALDGRDAFLFCLQQMLEKCSQETESNDHLSP